VLNDDGTETSYPIMKFARSNQGNAYNQRVLVGEGDRVEYNSIIADGPSTDQGELALGKNMLVAFMSWEGTTSRTRSSSRSASSPTTC
jgi:DNA-directed RNA polymerase subunit beta